ncbi:glycosyltransferase [Leucobacter sp. NPDC077196]|uniref:glycosyltransferase n=1 Tax=Leucobacter sp. NPDC077196 TaxID=3154959 RepID=UPI00343F6325
MKIVVWYLHGGWMQAFLSGSHEYLVPIEAGRDLPPLPENARSVEAADLADAEVDLVVLQRTEELEWAESLLGRRPGRDVAAVFVEHNTPKQSPVAERHFLADRTDIPVVHVTHFNRLIWDSGAAPTVVIEHGIPDPGARYTGEIEALGIVVNEPVRRGRVTGTDLLPGFASAGRLDCFGIATDRLPQALGLGPDRLRVIGDLPTERLHTELARRRAYVHPMRWTSLGLSLLEAMFLGMPVLALDATEAGRAVPPEAGALSADPAELVATADLLLLDPDEARRRGVIAREAALARYGLSRFLDDWDAVLADTRDAQVRRTRSRTAQPHLITEGALS